MPDRIRQYEIHQSLAQALARTRKQGCGIADDRAIFLSARTEQLNSIAEFMLDNFDDEYI